MQRTAARIVYVDDLRNTPQLIRDTCAEKAYSRIFVLLDTHTEQYCYPKIKALLPPHQCITIQAGEAEKNISTCTCIWEKLAEAHADRSSVLINIGGGVIGDMGGFAASTYMRGIDFIQIPTTLLAQVDASVGGKVAVDLQGIKNLIGVFREPEAVIISTEMLRTLPAEQMRSGLAEMLKHGIIADAGLWNELKKIDLLHADLLPLIRRSVQIKEKVVDSDPMEKGLRKILNYGHTVGHAIETYSLRHDAHPLLHGEAIAIGMICEAWIAMKSGILAEKDMQEIIHICVSNYAKYPVPGAAFAEIAKLMLHDKKNKDGNILCSLPDRIGNCTYDQPVQIETAISSLSFYAGL